MQQGAVDEETVQSLELLREAVLKQMKPYQALDARLFLLVNHLPHTPFANSVMYAKVNAGQRQLLVSRRITASVEAH